MKKQEIRLGEILKSRGLLDEKAIQEALKLQEKEGGYFGEKLVQLGYATEDQILWALAEQYNLSFLPIEIEKIDPKLVLKIPKEFALQNLSLPLYQIGDTIAFAIGAPQSMEKVEKLKTFLKGFANMDFEFSLSSPKEIQDILELIHNRYQPDGKPKEEANQERKEGSPFHTFSGAALADMPLDFYEILENAVQKEALAIHFLVPSSSNLLGKILIETEEEVWENKPSPSVDWMMALKNQIQKLPNPYEFPYQKQNFRFEIEITENGRFSLHRFSPFPSLQTRIPSPLPENPSSGIVLFLGHPKARQRLIFQWMEFYKNHFPVILGLSSPFYPHPPEIYWEKKGFPPFPCHLLYTHGRKDYFLKEILSLCPNILLEQDYLSFSRYFLKKWDKFVDLPLSEVWEAYSFPILCSHCSQDLGKVDFMPPSIVLKEYKAPGCEKCGYKGFQKWETFVGYWDKAKIDLLTEVSFEDRQRKILEESPLLSRLIEANHKGKLSAQVCQIFLE